MLVWVVLVLTVGVVTLRRGAPRKRSTDAYSDNAKDVAAAASPSTRDHLLQRLYAANCWVVTALALGVLILTLAWPAKSMVGVGRQRCAALSPSDRASLLAERAGADHPIVTAHREAQVHFNQGLLFRWAFNAVEASNSFELASERDPSCGMCWWGKGYALSPHLNYIFDPSPDVQHTATENTLSAVRKHVQQGLEVSQRVLASSPDDRERVEREVGYMQALLSRCTPKAMTVLDQHAAELVSASKMLELWLGDPSDVDAGVLAAESIMLLYSWKAFRAAGEVLPKMNLGDLTWQDILKEVAEMSALFLPSELTMLEDAPLEIGEFFSKMPLDASVHTARVEGGDMWMGARAVEEILLRVLHTNPSHPFAVHLHIHLTEAGPPGEISGAPIKTVPFADNLVMLGPHAGHLLHMPSHTYLRVGQYEKAVQCNIRSYEHNLRIGKSCLAGYVPEHDLDVLVYAASSAGMLGVAEKYAKAMQTIPEDVPGPYISKGHEYITLILVWLRFGQWEKIHNASGPPKGARGGSANGGPQFSKLIWRFAHFMAASHRHQSRRELLAYDETRALAELSNLLAQVPEPMMTKPGDGVGIYSQPYTDLGKLYLLEAAARSAVSNGDLAAARGHLEKAVKVQDSMGYMEPPRVHQPVRQCLGWLLFTMGDTSSAGQVFLEDLAEVPLNPWSLFGLASLHKGKDESLFLKYRDMYEQAWKGEQGLSSSCPMIFQNEWSTVSS